MCKDGSVCYSSNPRVSQEGTYETTHELRVRWYEHIDGCSDRSTLVEFEKWLRKRVEILFNPLEDLLRKKWNKKQRILKSKQSLKLIPRATSTERMLMLRATVVTCQIQSKTNPDHQKKEQEKKTPSSEKRCVICKHKHPVAFCPVFKSKNQQERRKIAWDHGLCFNCLKANH